jgi:hypothetical protein
LDSDRQRREVTIHTPLRSLEQVDVLHLGDLIVDPESFADESLAVR